MEDLLKDHLDRFVLVENTLDEISDLRRVVAFSDDPEKENRLRYLLHRLAVDVLIMEHIH